ncbi:MAG: ral substrate transporter [Proteobacteria bacterium]|nr:ral substrate transporter [Pseudomonadota bacterium]
MVIPQVLFVLAILPSFLWVTTSLTPTVFIIATTFISAISSPQYSAVYAAINESLPRAVRARVFALIYSVPVAVFGGTTQPLLKWMLKVTGSPISIAIYLTGISTIGLVAMILMHESSPRHRLRVPQIGEPVPL